MARPLGYDLYRLYSDDDVLLYVGVSGNTVERLRKHSHKPPGGKWWWPQVGYCTLEYILRLPDALAAERAAIGAEWPAFNVRSVVRGA